MSCALPEPVRSLSEVAREARTTLSFTRSLPSVKPVIDKVLAFLEGLRRAERPQVLLVVGDWGEGKTAIYEGVVEPWCTAHGCRSVHVTALRVFECFDEGRRLGLEPSDALVYAIACSLHEGVVGGASIDAVMSSILERLEESGDEPILVYVDEFEDIVARFDTNRERVIEILQALLHLMNVESRLLQSYGLERRLHLGIAVSRAAYQVLHSRGETSSIWPRIARRAYTVELRRLTKLEAAYLLEKLVDYVYGGRVGVKELAEPLSLLNPVLAASMGLPGALERAVNTLVHALRSRCERGSEKLTLDNAVDVMSIIEVNVEGFNERVLISDEYEALEERCVESLPPEAGGEGRKACRMLLLSGHGVRVEDIDAIARGASRLLARRGFARRARLYRIVVDPPSFMNAFMAVVSELEKDPSFETLLREIGDPLRAYRELLDPYTGFCSDGGYCVTLPYLEEAEAELGERIGSREYGELLEEVVRRLVEAGVLREAGRGLLVPFHIYSRYVFTHEIMLLEFVERRYRLRVWREARRLEASKILPGLTALVAHRLALRMGMSSSTLRVEETRDEYTRLSVAPRDRPASVNVLGVEVLVPRELRLLVAAYSQDAAERLEEVYRGEHLVVLYSIGAPPEANTVVREAEARINAPVILIPLTRSAALRLAALGVWASSKGVQPDKLVELLHRILEEPSTRDYGIEGPRVYQLLARIAEEHQLDRLSDDAVERLRSVGILLPSALRDREGRVRSPEELVEAARWLSLYPERLEGEAANIGEVYASIDDGVRRHLRIGARRSLLSADIESAEELAKYITSLEALNLVEYDRGLRHVRLTPRRSQYLKRLYSILSRGPLELQEVAKRFIDASGGYALKALVESAVELGLLEYTRRGGVILSVPDVSRRIAEVRSLLDKTMSTEKDFIEKLGYLVFAKKRGFRVSLTREVVEAIRDRLSLAEKLGESYEAMRLSEAARKLLWQVLGAGEQLGRLEPRECNRYSRHLQLIHAADRGIRLLLHGVETNINRVRLLLESLQASVDSYIAEGVELRCSVLDEAARALEEARRFLEERLTRSQVEERMRRLWERMSEERFPFYYRSDQYCSSYKWWYIAEEIGLKTLTERLNEIASRLENLKTRVGRAVEEARRSLDELRVYRERLEERGPLGRLVARLVPVPERLPKLGKRASYDLASDADIGRFYAEVLEAWLGLVDASALRERVSRIETLLDEVKALKERVEALRGRVEAVTAQARRLLSLNPMLEAEKRLASIIDEGESLASLLEKSLQELTLLQPEPKSLEEALALLEKVVSNHREIVEKAEAEIEELERMVREVAEELRGSLEKRLEGYTVIEAIVRHTGVADERLRSVLEAVEKAGRLLRSNTVEGVAEAWRIIEELPEPNALLESIARVLGLEQLEVEVLAAVVQGRRRVSELEEKLGGRVWEVLRKLYERGLVDVTLEPRRRPSEQPSL